MVGAFMVLVLSLAFLAPTAHAELISQEQIEEQNRVVLIEVVDVLREDIKLMQMILIRQLEAQIEALEAQIDAQSP